MERIQILALISGFSFLAYVAWLIFRGKLREEYAFIWIICTLVLIVFSFWRDGLVVISRLFGVFDAPNMVFIGSIFAILVYLLHLSVTVSKLQQQYKKMAQEIALLKEQLRSRSEKK